MKIWPALALLAAVGSGGFWAGHRIADGKHAAELLRQEEAQRVLVEQAHRKEQQRLAAMRERDALARRLEEAAYADPDADRPALSAGSVRRLNSR